QGSFDANQKLPEGLDSLVRQPGLVAHFLAEQVEWLFTGIDFHPADFFPAAVDLFYCSIENAYRGLPDIDPGTVAFDEWNDRVVRHNQLAVVSHGDLVPGRDCQIRISHPTLFRWYISGFKRASETSSYAMASIMAFRVALGRIAFSVFTGSVRK